MMNRREFILRTAAGAAALHVADAFSQPCPPPQLGLDGSQTVATTCTSASDAEADWIARSTGPGVVWAHDFRTATEVDRFRWIGGYKSGNSPNGAGPNANYLRRITSDGIGANQWCMEIIGGISNVPSWWRPFSPQAGDRGASMTDVRGQPVRLFPTPTEGGNETSSWGFGNYAHADYNGLQTTKDGNDFWIQWRLKIDPGRRNVNPGSGKTTYITRTERSLTAQEINVQLNDGSNYPIELYTAGSPSLQGTSNGVTDGGLLAGQFTNWSDQGGPSWITPYGVWDTFMIHVIPGHEGQYDQGIEMWAAHQGATQWTQIWKRYNYKFDFNDDQGNRNGWNAFIASAYTDGTSAPWYQRYAQIIFSRQRIALPAV